MLKSTVGEHLNALSGVADAAPHYFETSVPEVARHPDRRTRHVGRASTVKSIPGEPAGARNRKNVRTILIRVRHLHRGAVAALKQQVEEETTAKVVLALVPAVSSFKTDGHVFGGKIVRTQWVKQDNVRVARIDMTTWGTFVVGVRRQRKNLNDAKRKAECGYSLRSCLGDACCAAGDHRSDVHRRRAHSA